jgi:DNA (cytosine-5)-methyltransferase 1
MYGLDLFSGIGGITEALRGYVRPIAYCENDRHATAVLLSCMAGGELPWAPIWDDVRTLKGSMLHEPEIIYGGFPCQDISVAGRGKGLDGERSGLFFEIARLVSEIRPRFVFLENVPAITTRGGVRVIAELESLRYDARWGFLSASDVGANHLRERWWLLAHARHSDRRDIGASEEGDRHSPNGIQNPDSITGCRHQSTILADAASRTRTGLSESGNGGWWSTEPDVGRVDHGIPMRVDRLRGLGNAVVPAQAREAFERLMGLK